LPFVPLNYRLPPAQIVGLAARMVPALIVADDAAIWIFTSGTSGSAKQAVLRHRHLASYVISWSSCRPTPTKPCS
jgi:acyl-CoA synthetase (AMP-forming)/AMP-acid ligase II